MATEQPHINFYWFTGEQILKIRNHLAENPKYVGTVYSDLCLKVALQLMAPTLVRKLGEEDPEKYAFSTGEAIIPPELFEEICVLIGKKFLIGDILLDDDKSAGNVLSILPPDRKKEFSGMAETIEDMQVILPNREHR